MAPLRTPYGLPYTVQKVAVLMVDGITEEILRLHAAAMPCLSTMSKTLGRPLERVPVQICSSVFQTTSVIGTHA